MDLLKQAIASERPVTFASRSGAPSVALFVPKLRTDDCIAFAIFNDESRYLRITEDGHVDLNGRQNGPWTLFRAMPCEEHGSSVFVFGVKSGRYLSLIEGQFAADSDPYSLDVELSSKRARPQEETEGAPMFTLRTVDGSRALARPIHLERCQQAISEVVFVSTPEGNLACGPAGRMHWHGAKGKWAQWGREHNGQGFTLRNVGHSRFLALGPSGDPFLTDTPTSFQVDARADLERNVPREVHLDVLSQPQIAEFKERGYIIIRNAVPQDLVKSALRAINHRLGAPDCWGVDEDTLNATQFAMQFKGPVSKAFGGDILYKSPIFWSVANVLLGVGCVAPIPKRMPQVALRFPVAVEREQGRKRPGTQYHIDGMGTNRLCPFTILCGVALSDQTQPDCGNLHVFPGSHLNHELQRYYSEKIQDDNQNELDSSKPDLGEPVQVLLEKGDIVIAHQLLAHRIGINYSENIRYQLYYRLRHVDHDSFKHRVPHEPWIGFAI